MPKTMMGMRVLFFKKTFSNIIAPMKPKILKIDNIAVACAPRYAAKNEGIRLFYGTGYLLNYSNFAFLIRQCRLHTREQE